MSARWRTAWLVVAAAVLCGGLAAPAATAQFSPAYETRNLSKTRERARIEFNTPRYQAELRRRGALESANGLAVRARDPERDFFSNLCWSHGDGCAGDVRLYGFETRGYGIVEPVLFTARNGATISGHVWATRAGPSRRPGIVITSGSVQAPEQAYWWAAQTLAKRGFVVLTFDPQGQGRSDTSGEGRDRNEGVPSQEGRPFYDGTEDAIDFLLSTPARRYRPRRSCTTGTDHSAKQRRRVRAGLNAPYNPLASKLNRARIGLAGHSLGAAAISFVGQKDPRVDAIVAWDGLREPEAPTAAACASAPETRTPARARKPALGMDADYGLPSFLPAPKTSLPDPNEKNEVSKRVYSRAGVDTGELSVRGGTHFEWSYVPNETFSATLRGIDLAAWYTAAWMEVYLEGDPGAMRDLRTARWRSDPRTARIDPDSDGNVFSRYYLSRLDVGRGPGPRLRCEDLRRGCPGLGEDTCGTLPYSYLAEIRTPDGRGASGRGGACGTSTGGGGGSGSDGTGACTQRGTDRNDVLTGTAGRDVICAGDGNDVVRGLGGDDALRGEGGRDVLRGGDGDDALDGGEGDDVLRGDAGADACRTGRGDTVRDCE